MRAIVVLVLVGMSGFPADKPSTMVKIMVKLQSADTPKGSFAAEPKRMYRAGSRYCRIEENPDTKNGIHGLMVINEPDVWMINRFDKTGRHIVDQGPTYNCRLPIFVVEEDIKSAGDLKHPLMDLEFGRELEFFRSRSSEPKDGPTLLGKVTKAYTVKSGDADLCCSRQVIQRYPWP